MSLRAVGLFLVLCAVGCTDLLPTAPQSATILISRSSLGAAAAEADSVHVVVARLGGAVVAEAGAPFIADSVAIAFPLVLLDETEPFQLTLTFYLDGGDVLTETVPFTARRDGSVVTIRLRLRDWTPGTGVSPSPREGAALTHVPGFEGALLTGGLDAAGDSLNDAWMFDGTDWRSLPAMPDFRRHHVIVPLGRDSALVIGGLPWETPEALRVRTLVFNGVQWSTVFGPVSRDRAAAAFDVERGEIVLFGGTSPDPAQRDGTTFVRDRIWHALSLPGPSARVGHAMVYDPDRRAVLLLGGTSLDGVDLNDVWVWNGQEAGWSALVTSGNWPARSGHAAFYDPGRGSIMVVGGQRGGEFLSDIWELRGERWTEQMPLVRPPLRAGPGAFLDSRDVGVLVSGRGPSGLVTDWWTFR